MVPGPCSTKTGVHRSRLRNPDWPVLFAYGLIVLIVPLLDHRGYAVTPPWPPSIPRRAGAPSRARAGASRTCRLRCSRSEDADRPRRIRVNPTLNAFRGRASEMLRSEAGSALRKRCSVDVETAFGNIKRNLGFTRFTLRGLEKVELEWRLVATGHNIRKPFLAESRKAGAGAPA
ncbi:transposase [Collinsella sp. An271]|uniref:transposase n=1 Tax=Collinsella sp. An271 TaxID=1965616 RepID=UPI0031B85568